MLHIVKIRIVSGSFTLKGVQFKPFQIKQVFLSGPIIRLLFEIWVWTSLTVITAVTLIIDTMAVKIRDDSFHTCMESVRITWLVFCDCDQQISHLSWYLLKCIMAPLGADCWLELWLGWNSSWPVEEFIRTPPAYPWIMLKKGPYLRTDLKAHFIIEFSQKHPFLGE